MYSGSPIGTVEISNSCGACGPANPAQANCRSLGPEYTYSGYGGCSECQFNCVNTGIVGTVCTPGSKARCKKTQYLGNTQACCLGQRPPGYPQATCDPSLTPSNSNCTATMQLFCKGPRLFNNSLCKQWTTSNPSQGFLAKKNFCTLDAINGYKPCRDWVMSSENQGKLDSLMVGSYCQKFPKDPLCTCVMSEIPCPNKFDLNCVQKGGYKTKDMITTPCPNVMNCIQFLSLSPGAQAIATNVNQNCTQKTVNSGSGKSSNSGSSSSGSGNSSTNSGNSISHSHTLNTTGSTSILGIVLLFGLIVLIVAIILIRSGMKKNKIQKISEYRNVSYPGYSIPEYHR